MARPGFQRQQYSDDSDVRDQMTRRPAAGTMRESRVSSDGRRIDGPEQPFYSQQVNRQQFPTGQQRMAPNRQDLRRPAQQQIGTMQNGYATRDQYGNIIDRGTYGEPQAMMGQQISADQFPRRQQQPTMQVSQGYRIDPQGMYSDEERQRQEWELFQQWKAMYGLE